MADNLTKAQRSFAMSRIRSRGNTSTEQALVIAMRKAKITGWRRNSKLCGRPDFVFPASRAVVFVDGCFWHGCPRCDLGAKSNREYWRPKIQGNLKRDQRNTRQLRKNGWTVVRIREHELVSNTDKCLRKIIDAIESSKAS
jgi:DNA mismatch endonuclease (patch repair protein)